MFYYCSLNWSHNCIVINISMFVSHVKYKSGSQMSWNSFCICFANLYLYLLVKKSIIKSLPHGQSNFCQVFKSPAGYWKCHVQGILAESPDHRPINFMMLTHLTTPQEYLQQFFKNIYHNNFAPLPINVLPDIPEG